MNLQRLYKWLPYTFAGQSQGDTSPELSVLLRRPELQKMAQDEDVKPVLGAARMLSGDSLLPDDHMFTALLRTGLIKDMLFLCNNKTQTAHLIVELGPDVCGHAKVAHGGLLSAINDETYGALIYSLKYAKIIPSTPAVTANLSINYRKPVPGSACLMCSALLAKTEGRKLHLECKLTDLKGEEHYTDGTALFINLRESADTIVKPNEKQPLEEMHKKDNTEEWNEAPRYMNMLKDMGF